jgi:hypothetical protein
VLRIEAWCRFKVERPERLSDRRIDFVGDNEFEILKCGNVDIFGHCHGA